MGIRVDMHQHSTQCNFFFSYDWDKSCLDIWRHTWISVRSPSYVITPSPLPSSRSVIVLLSAQQNSFDCYPCLISANHGSFAVLFIVWQSRVLHNSEVNGIPPFWTECSKARTVKTISFLFSAVNLNVKVHLSWSLQNSICIGVVAPAEWFFFFFYSVEINDFLPKCSYFKCERDWVMMLARTD